MINYAACLESGQGVRRNTVAALSWSRRAYRLGAHDALDLLNDVRKKNGLAPARPWCT